FPVREQCQGLAHAIFAGLRARSLGSQFATSRFSEHEADETTYWRQASPASSSAAGSTKRRGLGVQVFPQDLVIWPQLPGQSMDSRLRIFDDARDYRSRE